MDSGHLELSVLKRRQAEIGVHLADPGAQRRGCIGRVHADGQRVEAREFTGAEFLCCSHLQQHRLNGDFHGANGDLVLFGQIADALEVGIAGVEK